MCDLAELLDHGRRQVVHGLHAAEFVGIREEITLERWRAGGEVSDKRGIRLRYFYEVLGGPKSGGLDGAGDVEHGEAFGNDHGVEINVTAAKTFLHVDGIRRLVEEIFSGLERTAAPEVVPEDERPLAANDAGGLKFKGDAAGGVSGAEHHEGLRPRFHRNQERPGEPGRAGERCDDDEPEDLAHDG